MFTLHRGVKTLGTGWKAYRLKVGTPAKLSDLVSILDAGPMLYPHQLRSKTTFTKVGRRVFAECSCLLDL
jgi:hypothetical protein